MLRAERANSFKSARLIGFAPDNVYEWQDRHFDGGTVPVLERCSYVEGRS